MDRREFLASSATGVGLLAASQLIGCAATLQPGAQGASRAAIPDAKRERALGIGGFFFRARDPRALSRWYATHLGVDPTPTTYEEEPWRQEAGPTVFAPFPQNTNSFGRAEQQWMINFRVRSLDAIARQLRDAGIEVEIDATEYPNGVFELVKDPEGNPIQLWEPRSNAAALQPGAPK